MERLNEKIALVTGANSGIGKCLVEQMVNQGIKVVGIARRIDRLKTLADELKNKPGKLFPLQCDLSNENEILRVIEWIEKNLGCIDILVNNAAINIDMTLQNVELEDLKKTFDVNVLGLTCITKEVLKLMKKKGIDNGIIVNVNDVCGMRVPISCDRPVSPAYISSKFALTAMTECLRAELAQLESNIKVICICPGLVETEMTQQFLKENPRLALKPKDVSDCIMFTLQTPETVLIRDLVVTPIRDIV